MRTAHPRLSFSARAMTALLFFASGLGKLPSPAPNQAFTHAFHGPATLVWPAGLWDVRSALAPVPGVWRGPASVLLAGWRVLNAVTFPADFPDAARRTDVFKHTRMAGAFLLLSPPGHPGGPFNPASESRDLPQAP